MSSLSLLQGIFPTQESNPGLLHCRQILYQLSYQGSLIMCDALLSCLQLCDPMDCSWTNSSVHGDSPGKNTGVGCHALLQGIFPTRELNQGLLHCTQILYQLSYQP